MYYWFVSGFGKVEHLQNPYMSAFDNPIMGSIVTGAVQCFFAYRVWVLSDRKALWYSVIIVVVSQLYISNTSQSSFYLQCSAINTVSAFAGGIYVSTYGSHPSSHLTIAVTHNQEVY